MTRIHDDPEVFATTALAGFSSIYSRNVRAVTGGVVRSTATPDGKVAVVVGGGSGHYPSSVSYTQLDVYKRQTHTAQRGGVAHPRHDH